jgi:hypothetical protein
VCETERVRELNTPHQERTNGKLSQAATRNWRRSVSRRREEENTDKKKDWGQNTKKIIWRKKTANS